MRKRNILQAAKPYTETVGNDQYIRMLFIWGYGPLDITDLKIGETSLDEYDDIEIENRSGEDGEDPITLYTSVVDQNDLQVKLTAEDGYELRTTDTDTDEFSVDITFQKGLVEFERNGKRRKRNVQVEVQYAPTGTENWSAGASVYSEIEPQLLEDIQPPGTFSYTPTQANYHYRFCKRIDLVVIDRASGRAEIIYGQKNHGFDENGNQFLGLKIGAPKCPQNKIEVAEVVSLGDTIGIEVFDKRSADNIGPVFETEHDFAVSMDGEDIVIAAGSIQFKGFDVSSKQAVSLRHSLRFKVPRGQYDVRLRRMTQDQDDDDIFDEVFWTALRSVRYEDPLPVSGLAVTALRIKATDQLNGVIDQFSGIVTAKIPDWTGSVWQVRATSNPASVLRHVLQGPANARPLPDERIDLMKLQGWHDRCAENEREFNAVLSGGKSVMDVISDVAAAGRASPTIIDGRWGIVEDVPQGTAVQHFTPRNSYGFEVERAFEDRPHALRVKFYNREKGFQLDERLVFDDGYDAGNASKFETLELAGVTDPDQIWRDGRYHLASARLRPELYSFYTDIEHIVCTRGDMVRLTHDAALIGLQSARIKNLLQDSGNVTGVMLDSDVIFETGKNYVLRVRCQSGSFVLKPLINSENKTRTVVFQTVHDQSPLLNAGDLCVFGESGSDSLEVLIKSIEPQDDLTAKITCLDAAPALHAMDQMDIPVHESVLAPLAETVPPLAPVIKTVQSGAEAVKRNADGSFSPQIILTLAPPPEAEKMELNVRIKSKEETDFVTPVYTQTANNIYAVENVEEGEFYDLELKYIRRNNIASVTTRLSNHEVIGLRAPPANVTAFTIAHVGDTAHLSWAPVQDIDLSHYQIRFSPDLQMSPVWNGATELVPRISKTATSVSVPAMDGHYLIKAVDFGGRSSTGAVNIRSDIKALQSLNVVEIIDEAPDFNGTPADVIGTENVLRLDAIDHIDDWLDFDSIQDLDRGENGFNTSGIYSFSEGIDLGAVYTSHILTDLRVTGLDLNNTMDNQDNVDGVESWDNTSAPDQWSVTIQIRMTDDDPEAAPAWSEWQNFVIGNYTARAFEFRALLSSPLNGVTPVITHLSVTIDMPDRFVSGQDIIADTAGQTVSFANPFRAKPAVAISAQNMHTGDYFELTDVKAGGFNIRFFDQDENPVSRSFDYLAKGYGLQQ